MESNPYLADCPTRRALDRIGDKWSVLIVALLAKRTHRFAELRRGISGISQKMLTQTLRSLERDGLVTRTIYAEVPPRVEYALTPLGRTLVDPIQAVVAWAQDHIAEVQAAQREHDQATAPVAA
jgi:DNA-binding HxlR family transcriptional regulator